MPERPSGLERDTMLSAIDPELRKLAEAQLDDAAPVGPAEPIAPEPAGPAEPEPGPLAPAAPRPPSVRPPAPGAARDASAGSASVRGLPLGIELPPPSIALSLQGHGIPLSMPGQRWAKPQARTRGWQGWLGRLDRAWLLPLGAAVLVALLALCKPDPYQRIILFLSDGVLVTIGITLASFVCILVVGLAAGLGRVAKSPLVRGVAGGYVEIIRGIPVLVQLLFIYYALPVVLQGFGRFLLAHLGTLGGLSGWLAGLTIDPFVGAVAGLTICYGAYVGEIYRAGIEAVPRGQIEAARSLGMSYMQSLRHVVLPQAVRMTLPALGNELIALLKDSSLVSVVAVADMTRRGREFMSKDFNPLETWLMVGLLYLVLTLLGSRLVAYLERRTAYAR